MAYRNGNGNGGNGGYGNNYYGNNGSNNGSSRNKLDLTKTAFYRPANSDINSAFGMVEGFIQEIQVRTVTGNNGHPMRVANVKLSAIMDDARVASMFGDAFVNPQYHSVLFRISYWESMVDTLINLNPRKGQKGIALIRNLKPEINTGRNGNLYKVVDASGCGMLFLTSKSRKQESAIIFADNQNGGQGYSQNGGQGYSQNGGQGYGQNGGQGYGQNGGQGYGQNGGQGYNRSGGQNTNQNGSQGNYQSSPDNHGFMTIPDDDGEMPF